jgi:hypothetical protein
MSLKRYAPCLIAASMLVAGGGAMAATQEQDLRGFAALRNVEAQSLTVQEMQATAGELNAAQIVLALTALSKNSSVSVQVQTAAASLAVIVNKKQVLVNAVLVKLKLYTP